jgi:hypothetical protein
MVLSLKLDQWAYALNTMYTGCVESCFICFVTLDPRDRSRLYCLSLKKLDFHLMVGMRDS